MAAQPLKPQTEYIRLPIPEMSAIDTPLAERVDIPVQGRPQNMTMYPRKR